MSRQHAAWHAYWVQVTRATYLDEWSVRSSDPARRVAVKVVSILVTETRGMWESEVSVYEGLRDGSVNGRIAPKLHGAFHSISRETGGTAVLLLDHARLLLAADCRGGGGLIKVPSLNRYLVFPLPLRGVTFYLGSSIHKTRAGEVTVISADHIGDPSYTCSRPACRQDAARRPPSTAHSPRRLSRSLPVYRL